MLQRPSLLEIRHARWAPVVREGHAPLLYRVRLLLAAFRLSLAPVFSSLCCLGTDFWGFIFSESAEFRESVHFGLKN